jgi:N-acetylglucosamine-6-sulfatase
MLVLPAPQILAAEASADPTDAPQPTAPPAASPAPSPAPTASPRRTPRPTAPTAPTAAPTEAPTPAPPASSVDPGPSPAEPATAVGPPDVPPEAPSEGDARPDIIVVMVDDLGYIPDDRVLRRLPNIRRIWLEGGLRFRQMYDETPLCCPSRASFLTGQHTWRHGVVRNDGNLLDPSGTIAVAFQEAGYHTIMAGNYLNKVRGSRVPPGWDRAFIKGRNAPPTFWRDGRAVTYRGRFVDDVMREQVLRWLRRAPTDRPLFAWVAPVAPHVCTFRRSQCYTPPVLPADRGARECRGIPDYRPPSYSTATHPLEARPMPDWPTGWELRRICQSLLVVDRLVGQISAIQARRGRAAVLAFTSDNGMSWGQHGFTFKQTPPSSRVPFYVAGTGIAPATVDALTSKIDIAPTLADVADIAFPGADGVSFAQSLRGGPYFGRIEHLEVMPRSNGSGGYPGWDALRTPRWHFIRWQTGRRELYDLEADPWELRNLVRSQEERAAMMEARLNELVAASGGVPPAPPALDAPGVVDRCGVERSSRPVAC